MRGKRARKAVEPVQAADLLDQVDLAGDVVVAVHGHGRPQIALALRLDLELEPLEAGSRLRRLDLDAEQRVEPRPVQRDHVPRRDLRGGVERPRNQLRAGELDDQPRRGPLGTDRQLGVKLLLEPRRGVGAQPERRRGAEDVGPVPVRGLEQHPGRRLRDLRHLAAHDPGDAGRAVAITDEHRLGIELALDPVERRHPLAGGRGTDDDLAARDPVEVEGVKRLGGHQHHVVGDVDDVRDRPHPGGDQPSLEPGRGGRDTDALEGADGEPRAQIRDLDVHRRDLGDRPRTGRGDLLGRPRRRRELGTGDRVQLARDPVDTHAIDPVRIQVELQHGLGDRQHLLQPRPGVGIGVEHHDPVVVLAELELALGEDHPVGFDAAKLRSPQLRPVGQSRPGQGDGDGLPGGDVGGTADDRPSAPAVVHLTDPEAVRVRVRLGREHPADDEAVGRSDTDPAHALGLDRAHREQLGDLLRLQPRIAVLGQPAERNLHLALPAPFCVLAALTRTAPGTVRRCRTATAGRGSGA